MKRLVVCAGVVGLVLSGLSLQAPPASAAGVPGDLVTVKGHVRGPDGRGLGGIVVKVRGKAPTATQYTSATIRTSSTGRYAVRVPRTSGEYVGYQILVTDPDAGTTGAKWAPSYAVVKSDASPVVRDLRLQLGAGLSGRLTDAAGRPVRKGLAVIARLRTTELPIGRRSAVTRTTAGGRYRFTGLPAGPTTLCFEEVVATEYSRCWTGAAGGVEDPSKASRLSLTTGRTLRDVDFEYPRVKGGISGRVLLDGEGIDSDEHFAYVDLLDAAGKVLDTETTYDRFEFRELDPGTYHLRVHGGGDLGEELGTEYYKDAETLADATPVVHRRGQDHKGLLLDLTSD